MCNKPAVCHDASESRAQRMAYSSTARHPTTEDACGVLSLSYPSPGACKTEAIMRSHMHGELGGCHTSEDEARDAVGDQVHDLVP